MGDYPWKLVSLDVDGTLTRGHGWKFIAAELGRADEFRRINAEFLSGTKGEEEHLRSLLRLARGHRVDEVEAILERAPKIAGIAETVSALHAKGARVALLTHNPDYVCAWYVRRYSLDGYSGTSITRIHDGRLEDPGPLRPDKLAGLGGLLERWGLSARECAHVGDGRADARVFPYLGAGIAFNSSDPKVLSAADAVVRAENLESILPVLAELTPRRPRTPSPAAP
ncbi:MAG: HAD-IB family phosphatase [Thermoplasmata archaeon]|nr:HAD-IB family phosphatase [Thermoplasmata archaeon]